jgi:hypothetical protein
VQRDELPDRHRRASRDPLDAVRLTDLPVADISKLLKDKNKM